MKKTVQKLLASTLIFSLVLSTGVLGALATVQDHTGYAAYINGDISLKGTSAIQGDTVSVGGDIDLTKTDNSNYIQGSLYLNENAKITQADSAQITGQVVQSSGKTFSAELPALPVTPNVANNGGSLKTSWWPLTTISANTAYDTLTLEASSTFDTGTTGLVLTAKDLVLNGGTHVLTGTGKLIIFVENSLQINQSTILNENGDSDRVHIFISKGNFNVNQHIKMAGNIYLNSGSLLFNTSGSRINGNLVAAGQTTKLANDTQITGVVLTPNGKVTMESSALITGSLVGDSLSMSGRSNIVYAPYSIVIPSIPGFEPSPTPTPTATPTSEPALTPTPEPTATPAPSVEPSAIPAPLPEVIETPAIVDDIPAGPVVTIAFPYAYLYGYSTGLVAADDEIKRQEAAALIYRLLKQNNKLGGFSKPTNPTFRDLPSDDWSYSSLEYMTYLGVYDQHANKISPTKGITRGEVAKLIAYSFRIRPNSSSEISYADLPANHPYYTYIKALVDAGLYRGYGDNNIKPDEVITRAEYVTLINRIIDRDSSYYINNVPCPYADLDTSHWAYADLMRASFGFGDEKDVSGHYMVDASRKPDRSTLDYD